MMPGIQTTEHIDTILGRLGAYRGEDRVRVLDLCLRRLEILWQAKKISAADVTLYKAKILPKQMEAKRRLRNE